eukprot:jgi/Ulvmu1/9344/UM050_0095.1
MLRIFALLFTVALTHGECRPMASRSIEVDEFGHGSDYLSHKVPQQAVGHGMISPRNPAVLHPASLASKVARGVMAGRILQQRTGDDHVPGALHSGLPPAVSPSSLAALAHGNGHHTPDSLQAAQPATAPITLGTAAPEQGSTAASASSLVHTHVPNALDSALGPATPVWGLGPVPEASSTSLPVSPAALDSLYTQMPFISSGPQPASPPAQPLGAKGPQEYQALVDADSPSTAPTAADAPSHAGATAADDTTTTIMPMPAPPAPPSPRPPNRSGTFLDSFAKDPASQGRLALSVVVIVSAIMCCCSSAACFLFLLKRYQEADRDDLTSQWSVPQYARYIARRTSSIKRKVPPPLVVDHASLSASWPNRDTSRSARMLSSSGAPSLCAPRSMGDSGPGSGAWWEAVIAGGGEAEQQPPAAPAASPGVGRSPAASPMLSRMLSVLPEVTDELAHSPSFVRGANSSVHAPAPSGAHASSGGAPGGLARLASSEMTTVREQAPTGHEPLRFIGAPHVNRLCGTHAAAVILPSTADAASGMGPSSVSSSKESSMASVVVVPQAPAGNVATAASASVAPTDPRIAHRRAGSLSQPDAATDLPLRGKYKPGETAAPLQQFERVFSEPLSSRYSKTCSAPFPPAATPHAQGQAAPAANGDRAGCQGAACDLPRQPGGPHRQRSTRTASNGSINFMYSMRDVSQTLVVNQDSTSAAEPVARPAAPAAEVMVRASGSSCPPRREFLHGRARTPESSGVCGDSGGGPDTQSRQSSAELSAMARNVAMEWRHDTRGSGAARPTTAAAQPSRRALQRSSGLHRSRPSVLAAYTERAVEASKDPAWFGRKGSGASRRPSGISQTASALRAATSIATGEAASLAEAATQAQAAELGRRVPAAHASRRRGGAENVSDYALHWLSKTRLRSASGAGDEPGPQPPCATGSTTVAPCVQPDNGVGSAGLAVATPTTTKSFGCQADADTITAEVLRFRQSWAPGTAVGVAPLPVGTSEKRCLQRSARSAGPLAQHNDGGEAPGSARGPLAPEGPAAQHDVQVAAAGSEPLSDASLVEAASQVEAVERVPLLKGLRRSSSSRGEDAHEPPMSERLQRPVCVPLSGLGGAVMGGEMGVEQTDRSAVGAAALADVDGPVRGEVEEQSVRLRDRYGTQEGWVDSIETIAHTCASRTVAQGSRGEALSADADSRAHP